MIQGHDCWTCGREYTELAYDECECGGDLARVYDIDAECVCDEALQCEETPPHYCGRHDPPAFVAQMEATHG